MGGRSYHPGLGRFFSPDPLVVSPLDAQAYNRYAYALNRPLVFTDPTGYETQGLGNDSGGNVDRLPRRCVDGADCYRYIVVADPDGASALDSWNRSLQLFESQNGPGQGGPGFGSTGGGGYPFSANGVRHGNDHGQPGGSPAFTITVTPDMCAEIAACSGRQSKRGPVYIWHAPIDDLAETAVDIATDFIPGVAQAKTAYDAYQRIQNGEDPVDVLMAAGGDAVLGLIPGLKAGKKAVGKALDKVEDVADAAGDIKQTVKATEPYKRPSGATTPKQRASVQGQPCVDCGAVTPRQVADHKTPLVKEHYQTGGIDRERMRSTDAVQAQCPTCSARQGAQMSRYSREQKQLLEDE